MAAFSASPKSFEEGSPAPGFAAFKARSTFSAVISRPALLKAVPTTSAGGCPAEGPAAIFKTSTTSSGVVGLGIEPGTSAPAGGASKKSSGRPSVAVRIAVATCAAVGAAPPRAISNARRTFSAVGATLVAFNAAPTTSGGGEPAPGPAACRSRCIASSGVTAPAPTPLAATFCSATAFPDTERRTSFISRPPLDHVAVLRNLGKAGGLSGSGLVKTRLCRARHNRAAAADAVSGRRTGIAPG
mmetsp:Transcript_39170/g.84321  ORF Transcript_39170/g.84321 Transcript_39170/m.84321 type:complete len:243 (+) Transcript_39170:301-1029(+)